ncbi:MAG: hypothetical protein ACREFO_11890 [Acetobacteraceae bacterium]
MSAGIAETTMAGEAAGELHKIEGLAWRYDHAAERYVPDWLAILGP